MRNIFTRTMAVFMLSASATSASASDIVDTAATAGNFKKFVIAVKAAGFTASLKSSGPYTVFAPSDEAFAKLSDGEWDALIKDRTRLAQVLAYHVVPGKIMVADVKPGKVQTIQGESLTLKSDNGKIQVNDANVTESDINADNGVIHVIDTVVIPK